MPRAATSSCAGSSASTARRWSGTGTGASEKISTRTEALLAAAHAACFTMAFSFASDKAGFATEQVDTQAHVRLVEEGDGFKIDRIRLVLEARVPGIDEKQLLEIAEGAKTGCPLSKALACVPEITLEANLRG